MRRIVYGKAYTTKFERIKEMLDGAGSVVELCFGDIIIARHCRQRGIGWTGLDLNESFVDYAVKRGHDARVADLLAIESLPKGGVCLMVGSLYHFGRHLRHVLGMMVKAAPRVIIVEPVKTLSSRRDLLGRLARRFTAAGKGHEVFRFTEGTLTGSFDRLGPKLGFTYEIVHKGPRELYVVLTRR